MARARGYQADHRSGDATLHTGIAGGGRTKRAPDWEWRQRAKWGLLFAAGGGGFSLLFLGVWQFLTEQLLQGRLIDNSLPVSWAWFLALVAGGLVVGWVWLGAAARDRLKRDWSQTVKDSETGPMGILLSVAMVVFGGIVGLVSGNLSLDAGPSLGPLGPILAVLVPLLGVVVVQTWLKRLPVPSLRSRVLARFLQFWLVAFLPLQIVGMLFHPIGALSFVGFWLVAGQIGAFHGDWSSIGSSLKPAPGMESGEPSNHLSSVVGLPRAVYGRIPTRTCQEVVGISTLAARLAERANFGTTPMISQANLLVLEHLLAAWRHDRAQGRHYQLPGTAERSTIVAALQLAGEVAPHGAALDLALFSATLKGLLTSLERPLSPVQS